MTLDEIRAAIMARVALAEIDSRVADQEMALAKAELEAHDRAVAAMPALNGAAKPERAKRRDIAALVRDALTAEPQTVKRVAERAGVPPSRVRPALLRLLKEDDAFQTTEGSWTIALGEKGMGADHR